MLSIGEALAGVMRDAAALGGELVPPELAAGFWDGLRDQSDEYFVNARAALDRGATLWRLSVPPSAAGELVFHVFGAIAHFERRLISERTKAGLAAKKARGERTGTVRYGYTADASGRLVECPVEQAVLAQVRALDAAGLSQRAIVAELQRAGFLGRTGKPLARTQVQNILAA